MHVFLRSRLACLLLLGAIIAAAPMLFPSSFYYEIGASIFIAGLAVVGLNLLMGFAGQVSLGHAGFWGLGGYAVAIGPAHLGIPPLASLGLGLLLSIAVAWAVGRPILRLRGHYLAVATLGFGFLVAMVLTNEADWTGGPDGMGVARLNILGLVLRGSQVWYWVSAGVLLAGMWLALNIVDSPTGRALRALHDSQVAAAINGVDVARYKLAAFIISAAYASLAGSMAAFSDAYITPASAGFLPSIELVSMSVLGGMGSILGAVVGAAVLRALPQVLTSLHDYEHLVLGLIMMLIMIILPAGLLPSLAALLGRRSRKPSSGAAESPVQEKAAAGGAA
ncbi:MAG TPA: branched-chain amino acid ABC transporter permease [Hyphomicrobiaceae bacterium]|nr:branched-chain amino acid ABC transporter permease [Hyphomicrobiaceae bacterium]